MAAAVVVWIVSGYDALVDKFDDFAEGYLGRYQLVLVPASRVGQSGGMGSPFGGERGLSPEILERLARDPDVTTVDPVFQSPARVENPLQPLEERGGRRGPAADTNRRAEGERVGGPNRAGAGGTGQRGPGVGGAGANQPGGQAHEEGGTPTPAEAAQMLSRLARQPALVGTDAAEPPHPLVDGRWLDAAHPGLLEGVITRSSAELLAIKVGDELTVAAGQRMGRGPPAADDAEPLHVKVVGISEQPKTLPPPKFMIGLPPTRDAALRRGPASSALYVSKQLAEKVAGKPIQSSYAGIVLKTGADPKALQGRWAAALAAAQPAIELQSLSDVESEIDNSTTTEVVRTQALSATAIALLAALFIIYTTLSMGVHERSRQFAVLRAVALSKSQIAAIIAIESVVLGLIGWGGGLLAGWSLLSIVGKFRSEASVENASLGTWCILLSGVCALGGSLAAAIAPAWQATRVSPLDAMAPRRRLPVARLSGWMTAAGLLLICLNPLLVFYIPMADAARYAWSAAIGCAAMALGFVLLTPVAVIVCERVLGPLVATVLRIPPRLLATQLTTNLWRTVGTSVALTLGLGLFVAMQTWGYSMLGPFTPGTWVPDMLVVLGAPGLPDSEIDAVKHVPGVVSDQCLPLAVQQVKLVDDATGFQTRASAARQDTCVMVGVDPTIALRGTKPLFPLEFVAGSRSAAAGKLPQGRYCLVPDHFARESGLGVGDTFAVWVPPAGATPGGRGRRRPAVDVGAPQKAADGEDKNSVPAEAKPEKIEYEIAGVVSMPGWHWMSKQGFRQGRRSRADVCRLRSGPARFRARSYHVVLDEPEQRGR